MYLNDTDTKLAIMKITPDIAREWLTKNGINRPVSQLMVSRYTDSMRRGAWMLNGETIIFGEDGRLLDGQHRLMAVVQSGATIHSAVVFGISVAAFKSIDNAGPRTNAQRLHMSGWKNGSDIAAIVKVYHQYHCGISTMAAKDRLPQDVMFSVLGSEPDLIKWSEMANRLKKYRFLQSLIGFVLFAGSRSFPTKAEQFFIDCESGANLEALSPANILRNRIASQSRSEKIPRDVCFALYIKAWNAYAYGREISRISWLSSKEDFPQIIGYPMDPSLIINSGAK